MFRYKNKITLFSTIQIIRITSHLISLDESFNRVRKEKKKKMRKFFNSQVFIKIVAANKKEAIGE